MATKIVGIVGSYRRGHIIDSAVSAVLDGAAAAGAETEKIYLVDAHIEFCDNCRSCTQQQQVEADRGRCVHHDDMESILGRLDAADAIVLGSPINFFTVTAVTKRFVERLVAFAYWPWSAKVPRFRRKTRNKKAVIVTSSAAPGFVGRVLMPNALGVLKAAAQCLGATVVKKLYFGMAATEADQKLSAKALAKARRAGKMLV